MPNKYDCVRCGDDIRGEFITNGQEMNQGGEAPKYDMEDCRQHIEINGRLCAYCSHMLGKDDSMACL